MPFSEEVIGLPVQVKIRPAWTYIVGNHPEHIRDRLQTLPKLKLLEKIPSWLEHLMDELRYLNLSTFAYTQVPGAGGPEGWTEEDVGAVTDLLRIAVRILVEEKINGHLEELAHIGLSLQQDGHVGMVELVSHLKTAFREHIPLRDQCSLTGDFFSIRRSEGESIENFLERAKQSCIDAGMAELLSSQCFLDKVYVPTILKSIPSISEDRLKLPGCFSGPSDSPPDVGVVHDAIITQCAQSRSEQQPVAISSGEITIMVFRHGETDYNKERRMQGSKDIALNSKGIGQAEAVAETLNAANIVFDAMYTSDLCRAKLTGEILAKNSKGATVTPIAGFRERSMGSLEGMLYQEAMKVVADESQSSMLAYGESSSAMIQRLDAAWNQVVSTSQKLGHKTVGIVSHGGALNILFKHLVASGKVSNARVADDFGSRLTNLCLTIVENGEFVCYGEKLTHAIEVHAKDELV